MIFWTAIVAEMLLHVIKRHTVGHGKMRVFPGEGQLFVVLVLGPYLLSWQMLVGFGTANDIAEMV